MKLIYNGLATLFLVVLSALPAFSQSGAVSIDLLVSNEVLNAATISPSSLGIDSRGTGKKIFDVIIRNNTAEVQKDLYIWVVFEATNFGRIIEVTQKAGSPFSLKANQIVQTNNNRIEADGGLQGVEESLSFDVDDSRITDFINVLKPGQVLPDDIYTFRGEIRQGGNTAEFTIAEISVTLGAKPATSDVDLFLNMPGGLLGSGESIATVSPNFSWQGPSNKNYRLIVVKDSRDNKQSPEALIQLALSTPVALRTGTQTGEKLLDIEIIDAEVQGTSFNVPPFGTQKLAAGEKYFWQVYTIIETASGEKLVPSAIWEFQVIDPGSATSKETDDEIFRVLAGIVSADVLSSLQEKGYVLKVLELDGKRYESAVTINTALEDFKEKVEKKEITINN